MPHGGPTAGGGDIGRVVKSADGREQNLKNARRENDLTWRLCIPAHVVPERRCAWFATARPAHEDIAIRPVWLKPHETS
jgi:hypothetical protein